MAGAFGYAADTNDVSMEMAEAALCPPCARRTNDALIVADGTSAATSQGRRRARRIARRPRPCHKPRPGRGERFRNLLKPT